MFILAFCLVDRIDGMNNPSLWFENVTINEMSLPTLGVTTISQFAPNTGGVTFDARAPMPIITIVPKGQRGSFAVVGFNYNSQKPTNIQSAQLTLNFRDRTTDVYKLDGPNNLAVIPRTNYDVSDVKLQVLKTTDGQPARNVEIVVSVCGRGK